MDVLDPDKLPDNPAKLKQLLCNQQKHIQSKDKELLDLHQTVQSLEQSIDNLNLQSTQRESLIRILEDQIQMLQQHRFGKRSERYEGDPLLGPQQHLFNEAEIVNDELDDNSDDSEKETKVSGYTRKSNKRKNNDSLERLDVEYDLDESQKQCSCGKQLQLIGEDVLEQIGSIPARQFIICHRRKKYACSCKECVRTAKMPPQPIPGSQASPQILADIMVKKFLDGLPLYRQEKIADREGFDLPRNKTSRWLIQASELFVALLKLIEAVFFGYDIALSDDTGIKVLKEDGKLASSQSALWIRRGGPPDKPVVLVDYARSKSGEAAYGLLQDFSGFLVTDGAPNFNKSVEANGLTQVLCNDHARRRFRKALDLIGKKEKSLASVAIGAVRRYGELYRIEQHCKDMTPEERYAYRQQHALPIWQEFIEWADQKYTAGVAHPATMKALAYLIKHQQGLQRYLEDGRLPISNIQSEHVAKTIALARKNFIFADTPGGAIASARIFSLLETARANGHNPYRYMTVVLTELPQMQTVEELEKLLPWNLKPAAAEEKFSHYPSP